jgi:hypothetical protein
VNGALAWGWSDAVDAGLWFAIGAFTVVVLLGAYALGEMLVDRRCAPPRGKARKRKGDE